MNEPNTYRRAAGQIRFARAYAAQALPWFAPALFRCRIVVTENVTVASIDLHYNVYWNPAVVADISTGQPELDGLKELGFIWVHEISHRLRQHAERRKAFTAKHPASPRDWNIAADFEINDNDWPGLSMPASYPGMLPQDFGFRKDLLAEEYLSLILQSDRQFEILPDEGSGVHGQPRPWESGDLQELSDLDVELIRRQVAERMERSGPAAIPPSWRSWTENVLTSKTNWRRSLSNRMSVALQRGIGSRIDYSFSRPGRRSSVYYPIITPTLSGDRTARIAVVVDTSGSMGVTALERSLAEVAQVIRNFDYPVTIIPCDDRTFEPVRIIAAEEAYKIQSLPGGGLTDMRAGIAAAEKLRPRPDVILVLTDGYTPYPAARGVVTVVFGLLLSDGGSARKPPAPPNPPFGKDSVVVIRPSR